jgi:hypothetical protein
MNERIKELIPKPWTFPYPDRELYTKEQFEKFAELIVKECADVAQMNTPDTEECEYTHLISEKIKEHFGVKE